MDFPREIISWYNANKRDLPWRRTTDPYIIWLSEIIMQQTRVEQGLPYFNRFSEKYPTVTDFALASEDEILNIWQGLGYYSRARNMHYTANMVMEEHAGYFPASYEKLLKLKGVGEYTAAAISSFASNEAKAVVDGNVFRLLSRYFGIAEPINSSKGKNVFTKLANELIDKNQPGLYNQAIMEFGALQCTYKNPDCGTCPLRPDCVAYNQNRIEELPVKIKKLTVRERYLVYIVAVKDGKILLNKRGPNDIWQNLHEFPVFENLGDINAEQTTNSSEFRGAFGDQVIIKSISGPVKHILSHQKIFAHFIEIDNFEENFLKTTSWFYADPEDLEHLAQPKLIFAFLKNFLKFK
jgi:A/G-specific adenine glycosylase